MGEDIRKLWPEPKPEKPVKHRFESAVGYCPECGRIEARNFDKFFKRLADVRKYIDEQLGDYEYECKTCGLPYVRTAEDAPKVDACPWCGDTRVVRRKK